MLFKGIIMIDEKIIADLREYLKDHYIPSHIFMFSEINYSLNEVSSQLEKETDIDEIACFRDVSDDASEYIRKHRKPGGFAHALDRKRKEKGLSPAELYKRANVDRRQYSRFMGPEGRHPSMNTVISFALALRLERQEFDELLQTAGYTRINSSTRDVCIMFSIEKNIYDIDEVNALLFAIGVEPLTRE
jgi:transcriptional regulator with XRE-family HTH domain